jgi:DNA-binding transcriptional MerR regulator
MNSPGDALPFPWEDAEPPDDAAMHAAADDIRQGSLSDDQAEPGTLRRADRPLVRKEYYSISEVADLVGLPAHVLRYWESQFSVLNPSKNRSGNRVYQRKEIRLILLVKQLLYDEKYTVEGAKQKLEQLRRGGALADATGVALDTQLVRVMRDDLRAVLKLLAPDAE